MPNPIVAFDEAGNTGQNLLDKEQPFFVLSSVYFLPEEIAEFRKLGNIKDDGEIHFVRLRRSKSGRKRILNMLRSNHVSFERVKIFLYHKRFMIITKIVDELIENIAFRDGIDLYEQGANIALSNLIYLTTPVLCGEDNFEQFLSSFIEMFRRKSPDSVERFYNSIRTLYEECKYEPFRGELNVLLETEYIINRILSSADIVSLDPAFPSFVFLASKWSEQLNQEFDIIHDKSKPIEHTREILNCFMAQDEPEVLVGYDRRKSTFPIKASGITFCDSKEFSQIQIADLFASAFAYLLANLPGSQDDGFIEGLKECSLTNLIAGCVWPSKDIAPEEMGTEEVGGINAVDYVADLLARKYTKKKQS